MSNSSPFSRRTGSSPGVPIGDVLGEYASYLEAQKLVDRLAKANFTVKGLSIVGNDLKTVERITGRLTYARAALTGAASGAWLGLFFGLLLVLFSPEPDFAFLFAAGFIGAGFGMIFGIVSYTISRRRRDFSSTNQVLAGSYQVIIDPSQTARARQALAGGAVWPPPLDPAAASPAAASPASANPAVAVSAAHKPVQTDASDTASDTASNSDSAAPDLSRDGAATQLPDAPGGVSNEGVKESSSEPSNERSS